jgi:hypothetical protein
MPARRRVAIGGTRRPEDCAPHGAGRPPLQTRPADSHANRDAFRSRFLTGIRIGLGNIQEVTAVPQSRLGCIHLWTLPLIVVVAMLNPL